MPQVGKPDLVPGGLIGLEGGEVGVVHQEEDQQERVHDDERHEDGVERRSGKSICFFCTGLPLARARWVGSTFSNLCPLSSNQRPATSIIFHLKKLGLPGIEPGTAG